MDQKDLPMHALPAIGHAPRPVSIPDAAMGLYVRGAAMEPEFRDGWIITVDPSAPAKHGDFVVARPEGAVSFLLRRLEVDGDTTYLRATNPDHPEPLIPLGAHGRVLGRVIYQSRSY